MTQHPEIFAALAAPFEPEELRERTQSGETFRYVKGTAIMNRLDNVVGPENWDEETGPVGSAGCYLCRLTVRLPDGTAATKTGVGAPGSEKAKADPGKTAATDAFKRAAVKFGIARYLYNDGVPAFAQGPSGLPGPAVPLAPRPPAAGPADRGRGREPGSSPAERLFRYCEANGLIGQARSLAQALRGDPELATLTDGQALAVWKILKGAAAVAPDRLPTPDRPHPHPHPPLATENGGAVAFGWPAHGGALFAWAKNVGAAFRVALVPLLDDLARAKGWPSTFKDWSPAQVEEGALAAAARVRVLPGYDGQFDRRFPDTSALKAKIARGVTDLLVHLGNPSPSYADVAHALRAQSEGLPAEAGGGQVLDDLDACEDVPLLEALLAAVGRDLADVESI